MADTFAVTAKENVPIEMRDRTVLRADVYRPSRPGNYPVLVCRTPYGKFQHRYIETARAMASRGYITVAQDIRGRYASDGEFFWQFQDNSATRHE